MAYTFTVEEGILSAIITILIATLFIHFAAKFVLDRSSIVSALLTATLSTLAATFVAGVVPESWGVWGLVISIVVWSAITAIFYRTGWIKAAIIGVVAWVLFVVVNLIIDAIGLFD